MSQIGKTRTYTNVDEATSPLLSTCPSCQVVAVPRGALDINPQAAGLKHCPNCGHMYGRQEAIKPNYLITSIVVTGAGGATTITVDGGSLQMNAAILPANASNTTITWTVTNGTGNATITSTGLLTAGVGVSNGTVTVIAKANDGTQVTGSVVITLSNQS